MAPPWFVRLLDAESPLPLHGVQNVEGLGPELPQVLQTGGLGADHEPSLDHLLAHCLYREMEIILLSFSNN